MSDNRSAFNDIDNWVSLETFPEKYPEFNLNQLRWLLRQRKSNGLNRAVRKVGKRLYIHEGLFAEWMMSND